MRHNNVNKILGRKKEPREAMFRNLVESLIIHGSIKTTLAKAKCIRPIAERLVTKVKTNIGSVNGQRELRKFLYTDQAVNKLIDEFGPKYKERAGGYTRITKLGAVRKNDAGETAIIEFV